MQQIRIFVTRLDSQQPSFHETPFRLKCDRRAYKEILSPILLFVGCSATPSRLNTAAER
jgi:hypothetical protein